MISSDISQSLTNVQSDLQSLDSAFTAQQQLAQAAANLGQAQQNLSNDLSALNSAIQTEYGSQPSPSGQTSSVGASIGAGAIADHPALQQFLQQLLQTVGPALAQFLLNLLQQKPSAGWRRPCGR